MKKLVKFLISIVIVTAAVAGSIVSAQPSAESGVEFSAEEKARLEAINLPEGFSIDYYAKLPGARSLSKGPGGTIFRGSRGQGKVYALLGREGADRAEEVITIADRLNSPNGVAYRNGDLYVAEIGRVIVFRDIADSLQNSSRDGMDYSVITDSYPEDRAHGWKFIAFGPDGMLYVPVGAPCNVCEREDPIYSSITRFDAAGVESSAGAGTSGSGKSSGGPIGRPDIEIDRKSVV